MKRKIYWSVLLVSLIAAGCRIGEKDDDLRPRPEFGFTTGTSTGYTETISMNTYIKFGLKAKHYENMESLVVTDSTGAVLFNVSVGNTALTWYDSVDVGSTTGLKRYNFTIKAGDKERTRTVFADIQ